MRIIMRAAIRACVAALLLLPARSYAQRRADPFQPADPAASAGGDRPGVIADVVDAPVTTVFKMVSDATGWTILLSPEVSKSPPKISLWIKNQSPEQVLDSVSTLAGLVVDRKGTMVAVLTFDEFARQHGTDKRVVPLRHASAKGLAANLQPFVATSQARVLADDDSNKLILLVPEPLLGSLLKLIEELDVPFEKDRLRVVALRYLDAAAIGPRLERFLAGNQHGGGGDSSPRSSGLTTAAASPEQPPPAGAPPVPGGQVAALAAAPGAPGAPSDAARAGSQWLVQFMIEPKLNVVVLRGRPGDVEQAEQLIKQLDVPPQVAIIAYPLRYTNAREVYKTLQNIVTEQSQGASGIGLGAGDGLGDGAGGSRGNARLKVAASEQNNEILVEGSPQDHERLAKIIAAIDKPLVAGAGTIRVYRLENASAEEVAKVILEVIEGRSGQGPRAQRTRPGPADVSQQGVSPAGRAAALPARTDTGASPPASGAEAANGAAAAGAPGAGSGPRGASGAAGAGEPAAGGEVIAAQVTAAPDINAVVVKATAAEQEEFAALIKELDKPRDQVMLEVTLVSVRSTSQFNLGVELSGASLGTKTQTIGFSTFGVGTVDPATGKLGFAVRPPFGGNFGVFRSNDFSLVLNALKSVGDTRVASSPRILVQDNATAQIKQLNREPIVTISQGQTSTLTGFGGFAEAGTTLDVIPHVSRDDWLRLEYQVNLSAFDQRTPEQQAANLPPPVRQNSSTGVVRIPADYTVVLGGLTATNDQRIRQGVPFLADVPVVGELFASRTNARSDETLYIFIRPILLRDPAYRDLRFLSENDVRRAKLSRRDFPENPIKSFSRAPGPNNGGAR